MDTTGERIKSIRLLRGYTQPITAEKAGLNPVLYRHYELGVRNPSNEQLKKIASALEVPASLLTPIDTDSPDGIFSLIYSLLGSYGSSRIEETNDSFHIVIPKDEAPKEVIDILSTIKKTLEQPSTLEDVLDGERMQMEVRQQKYAKSHLQFDATATSSKITVVNKGAPDARTSRAKLIKYV